jgi:hypothetical protein
VYAIGTINFTGDMPVALMFDGPSLGGFVCPATITSTELWKMAQVSAKDSVLFKPLTIGARSHFPHKFLYSGLCCTGTALTKAGTSCTSCCAAGSLPSRIPEVFILGVHGCTTGQSTWLAQLGWCTALEVCQMCNT